MPELSLDWTAVHRFVTTTLNGRCDGQSLPVVGSGPWTGLADAEPAKLAAVLVAGDRWTLEQNLDELAVLRALKEAALEVADARDWSAEGKRISDRAQFIAANPWAKRVIA